MKNKDEEYIKGAEQDKKTNITPSTPYMCCSEQHTYMYWDMWVESEGANKTN